MFKGERVFCSFCLVVYLLVTVGCQRPAKSFPSRDIDWETYSEKTVSAQVGAGKAVFVFVYPESAGGSALALYQITGSVLQELCNGDAYVALLHKYDNWDDVKFRHIVDTVGFSKEAFLILFSPNCEPVAFDPFSLKRKRLLAPNSSAPVNNRSQEER